tara:strand:+ start:271 stop:1428 length:1158 start_codon:yes stop_codon:yes gene_type:complete
MASFKKGLMEFGEGFLLSFGDAVATNIAEKAKQDRADILSTTKDLRTRIKAGKAADTKLRMKYIKDGNNILARLPGLDPGTLREALASPAYAKSLLAQADADTLNTAEWYKPIARKFNLGEDFNPYERREDQKSLGTLLKGFRTGPTIPKADEAKDEDTMAEDTIRTMFGGGKTAEKIIRAAEKRVGAQFSPEEIERYGGAGYVPRTVTSKGGAVNLRNPSDPSQSVAISLANANEQVPDILATQDLQTPEGKTIKGADVYRGIQETPQVKSMLGNFSRLLGTKQGLAASEQAQFNYLITQSRNTSTPITAQYLDKPFLMRDGRTPYTFKTLGGKGRMNLTPRIILRTYKRTFMDSLEKLNDPGKKIGRAAGVALQIPRTPGVSQ